LGFHCALNFCPESWAMRRLIASRSSAIGSFLVVSWLTRRSAQQVYAAALNCSRDASPIFSQ
jgi:hypothetical protein